MSHTTLSQIRNSVLRPKPLVLIIGLALGGVVGWDWYENRFRIQRQTDQTEDLLRATQLEGFDLRDATPATSVESLLNAIQRSGVADRVTLRVMSADEAKRNLLPLVELEQVEQEHGAPIIKERPRMTKESPEALSALIRQGIWEPYTLNDAANDVANLLGGEMVIHGRELRLYPTRGLEGPLVSKTLPITEKAERYFQSGVTGSRPVDVRLQLQLSGIRFCGGSRAELIPGAGKIRVVLPQCEMELLEALLNADWPHKPTLWERLRTFLHL